MPSVNSTTTFSAFRRPTPPFSGMSMCCLAAIRPVSVAVRGGVVADRLQARAGQHGGVVVAGQALTHDRAADGVEGDDRHPVALVHVRDRLLWLLTSWIAAIKARRMECVGCSRGGKLSLPPAVSS